MPKIEIDALEAATRSPYPAAFFERNAVRTKRALGDAAGLTQFGANLSSLAPGAMSALRHWHEREDELVFIVSGEAVLIDDDGETPLRAGDAAGFKAGVPNGHHLVNRSDQPVLYLEIGARVEGVSRAHYPDDDLAFERGPQGSRFTTKSGDPL